jgi:hypothetical protein
MKDPAENDRFLEIAIPIAKMIDKEKDIRIKRIDSIAKHLKWLEENVYLIFRLFLVRSSKRSKKSLLVP